MTDLDDLIAEAREQAAYLRGVSRDGSMPYSGELLGSLADALESVRAERDAAVAALDGAPEPAEPEWEAEKQYRAIIGRPWNILDRNAPKDVPIFEATGPKSERVVHLQRSEETHAWVERWEQRDVLVGPWLPVEGESNGV